MHNTPQILKGLVATLLACLLSAGVMAEDGHQLWLRYAPIESEKAAQYQKTFGRLYCEKSQLDFTVAKEELCNGLSSMLGRPIETTAKIKGGTIAIGTANDAQIAAYISREEASRCGDEGFLIKSVALRDGRATLVVANGSRGVMYGAFELLRLIGTGEPLQPIDTLQLPSYRFRLLNHWDNPDGTIERGYAGYSIWDFDKLPGTVSPLIKEYARFNASLGINGAVLNNVNVKPEFLERTNLEKVAKIADELRPYGIKVYLSVNFATPATLGKLPTADPLDKEVIGWWREKVDEIYAMIPDFGGFLVKASSEGLPGPQNYGRSHVEGANMLADALAPKGGIVMWRAFVYGGGDDRAKDAYREFLPFDGQFRKNVIVQVKNGPVDFQPREPFSPLFGAMRHTGLFPELQITQEYLGFSSHLAYLGTLFEEFLDADTYSRGEGSTVAKITDGTLSGDTLLTGIAGVANIGKDANWCGHHFAQANWYAFGRLAWNNRLSAQEIAEEWIKQTFTDNAAFVRDIGNVMMQSREAVVNYMTPIGLAHLMGYDHHYGPQPWYGEGDPHIWYPPYYHRADSMGIGFNRTPTGTNAVAQYCEPLRTMYATPQLCPLNLLLWFHHLPWRYCLPNGNDVWTEMCYRYDQGVKSARRFQRVWEMNAQHVDPERYRAVSERLATQVKEAIWWKDACLLYFQSYSQMPFPVDMEQPIHNLDELKKLRFDLKAHN